MTDKKVLVLFEAMFVSTIAHQKLTNIALNISNNFFISHINSHMKKSYIQVMKMWGP